MKQIQEKIDVSFPQTYKDRKLYLDLIDLSRTTHIPLSACIRELCREGVKKNHLRIR